MTEQKIEYLKNWLIKANEDIAVIKQLSKDNSELYTSSISFHAQQAVEKFLKAFLVFHDHDFPRTHDVDFLLAECLTIDNNDFENIDLKNLNDFAIAVRYPDDFLIPSVEEALESINIAIIVKTAVEKKIIF
jgi:HEPN domain-containing protein